MGLLKRFNREQLTLGAAALLSALLIGWQFARGGVEGGSGGLPQNERVYSIPRKAPLEFLSPKVDLYLAGRDIWEPPAAGRMPIPIIRPPEPKLGQVTLPPLEPRPDFTQFNLVALPGKVRTLAAAAKPAYPAGFPPEAEITALKDLKEPDFGGKVDLRKELMRPDGLSVVHRIDDQPPITGRIVLDTDQTNDGSVRIEQKTGPTSFSGTTIPASQINKSKPGTEDGIERGGEYEKEYLRRAKKLKDDDVEGHRKLGEWCRDKARMLPEARTEFLAALAGSKKKSDVGPKVRDLVLATGDVLRDLGAYDEAIAVLQEYIDAVKGTANDVADLHLRLGQFYAQLGYHERALISYSTANQLEPGRAPPRIAMARARLDLGETKQALDEIDALLLAGGPPDADARTVQGMARLRMGLAGQAEESLQTAIAVQPANDEALNAMGVAQALLGKPEAAASFLAAIKANQYRIEAWVNLAMLFLAEGRPVEAETLFGGAAQRDPDSAIAAAGPGFASLMKGALADAAAVFERARKLQPDDYWLAYALGRLKLREGHAPEALELFRASLRANPDFLPSTTDAALCYLMLATEDYRQSIGAAADKKNALADRAQKHRGHAETLLESAYAADPGSKAANAALGCVYATTGQVRAALVAFERASEVGKSDPLLDYGRGYVDYWWGADSPKQRLELAEVRFKYGSSHTQLTDPSDVEWVKECGRALQMIEDWRVQRVFIEDRFDGGQPSPAAAWIPFVSAPALQAGYEGDRAFLRVAGTGAPIGSFAALEHRDIPTGFLSVEGTMILESATGFESGFTLYTETPKGAGVGQSAHGIHFVFLEDPSAPGGKAIRIFNGQSIAARDKGPNRPSQQLGTLPASPTRIRFKLDRRDDPNQVRGSIYDFSVWDEAQGSWRRLTNDKMPIKVMPPAGLASSMMIQFWARSVSEGRKWSMGIDDVRVLIVEKQ